MAHKLTEDEIMRIQVETLSGSADRAAVCLLSELTSGGMTHTPDGAKYSVTSLRAALRGVGR